MQRLFRFYWKVQKLIVPGLRNSQYLYYETLRGLLTRNTRWLEVGCGHQFFPPWMKVDERELVSSVAFSAGLEFDLASLKQHETLPYGVLADIHKVPFRDESFTLVTANMVVEHLENPQAALAEIHRILTPGGMFVFHTTNYWNLLVWIASLIPQSLKNRVVEFLESRKEEDIYPTYYRINTAPAVRRHARESGFEVMDFQLVNSSAETIRLPPVVVFELLLIRLFETALFAKCRSNIVTVLRKSVLKPAAEQG
jgi:SAM-dependent methyltransferase